MDGRRRSTPPAVEQLGIWAKFFSSLPWQDLVPDQDHTVLTAGFGTFGNVDTRVSESDYATAAKTPDGSTIVVYMPTARTITLNMACLSGPAQGQVVRPDQWKLPGHRRRTVRQQWIEGIHTARQES